MAGFCLCDNGDGSGGRWVRDADLAGSAAFGRQVGRALVAKLNARGPRLRYAVQSLTPAEDAEGCPPGWESIWSGLDADERAMVIRLFGPDANMSHQAAWKAWLAFQRERRDGGRRQDDADRLDTDVALDLDADATDAATSHLKYARPEHRAMPPRPRVKPEPGVNYGYGDEDETLRTDLLPDSDDPFLTGVTDLDPKTRRAFFEAYNRRDQTDRSQGHGADPTDYQGDSTRKGMEYERQALQPYDDGRDPIQHEAEGDLDSFDDIEGYYKPRLPMESRDQTLTTPAGKSHGPDGMTPQLREMAEESGDPVLDGLPGPAWEESNGAEGADVDEDGFTESDDGDFPLPGWDGLTPEQQAAAREQFHNYLGRQEQQGRPPAVKTWSHRRPDGSFNHALDRPR
jgi:hypothetical protein